MHLHENDKSTTQWLFHSSLNEAIEEKKSILLYIFNNTTIYGQNKREASLLKKFHKTISVFL